MLGFETVRLMCLHELHCTDRGIEGDARLPTPFPPRGTNEVVARTDVYPWWNRWQMENRRAQWCGTACLWPVSLGS
jgi:hypothetical protein